MKVTAISFVKYLCLSLKAAKFALAFSASLALDNKKKSTYGGVNSLNSEAPPDIEVDKLIEY